MKIAVLGSNKFRVSQNVAAGPEIFIYTLVKNFLTKDNDVEITVFSSGDSDLPVRIESVNMLSSIEDENIGENWHKLYEFALISKAFSMKDNFDLYHVNIGNGEIVLPFAKFINKPILITLHSSLDNNREKKFLSLFKDNKNVYFVSISNYQKGLVSNLNYIKNIYHGVDLREFEFSNFQSEEIFWIGRGVPKKGLDVAFEVVGQLKKPASFFISPRQSHEKWLNDLLAKNHSNAKIQYLAQRGDVITQYRKSKLLLFPIKWEEPFGLVMIEAMACGTPVVAFDRGSVPEIIKDGETGFIVNPSDEDIRGNWTVKKTGIDGIKEAIEKIYSMPQDNYQKMRQACRSHVEEKFSIEKMIEKYHQAYRETIDRYNNATH